MAAPLIRLKSNTVCTQRARLRGLTRLFISMALDDTRISGIRFEIQTFFFSKFPNCEINKGLFLLPNS